MKNIFVIILTLFAINAFGQDSTQTNLDSREGYKRWTEYATTLRFGLGIQKAPFSEVGISRHKYIYNDLGSASSAYYTSIEWTPQFSKGSENTYGLKAGYELTARGLAIAIETKYQTDFVEHDFVITPKVGLTAMGIVNLLYGYNISTAGSPFSYIGHHQFSLVFNFNRKPFRSNNSKPTSKSDKKN